MNDYEINQYANELRETFSNNVPVDVYKICESLNIMVMEEDIKSQAYLICQNGKTAIIVNKNVKDQRKIFSIAHELGHFMLPDHSKHIFGCTYNDMDYRTKKPIEIEANKFASQLLMPAEILRADINDDINVNTISLEANKFNVSFSSMAIRLTQLAYDTMAIFCMKNRFIEWAIKSKDFEFELCTKKKISEISIASELFDEKKYQKKASIVSAEVWLEDPLIDNVYEEAIYFPSYDCVMAVVRYNPDDVESI